MSPVPSKLLKIWLHLTRWLLTLVVAGWVLLGLTWGALHWWIVPRIDEFRPRLEVQASKALGIPVRIKDISTRSNGLIPSFELSNVTLLDAEARVALSLPRILVALSPWSLWRLSFEQIHIEAPELDIRRLRDGRIVVAGLEVQNGESNESKLADWFFSQFEFVIRNGKVHWIDEMRDAAPIDLHQVDVVVRNTGRMHNVRLDATPPPGWGERFSFRSRFLQPLLSRGEGRWQDWDGQLFAKFDRIDLSELRHYLDIGIDVRQGRGALRAWLDVKKGQPVSTTADVALNEVDLTLGPELPPLSLNQIQGRLGVRVLEGGYEMFSDGLTFVGDDDLQWPGGHVRARIMAGTNDVFPRGEVQADELDLAALSQLLQRFPLPSSVRSKLLAYAPKGHAQKLTINWQGTASALQNYSAKGRLTQLEVMAVSPTPGVKGLNLDFELDKNSGQVAMDLNNGSVDVPEAFEESRIDFAKLSALARWQIRDEHVTVEVSKIAIANVDAQGTAHIKWESADPSKSANHSRYPGILDLQADLIRVEGNRVYRYLPLLIDQRARDYVHNAITAGQASNVRFDIRGDITQMPAKNPHQGIFKISADVQNASMAFVPRNLQSAQELPWPVLTDLSGKLLFSGMQLQVKDARAHLDRLPAVQVLQADVTIADLRETVVKVNASFKGPLKDELRVVAESPIGGLMGDALAHSTGTGPAEVKIELDLPIAHLSQSKVQGRIDFTGNDLQITPSTPKLQRARGQLGFNQASLSIAGIQARMLGGDVRLDGGLTFTREANSVGALPNVIRANGTASAEGLRQATELGLVTRLARFVSGNAAYTASLGVRRGQVEWLVQSNLQGLASSLPAPLEKTADVPMVLRVQSQLTDPATQSNGSIAAQERLSLRLGSLGTAVYEREVSSGQTTVLRGAIEMGSVQTQAIVLPASGVSANIQLPAIDVDAWQDVMPLHSEEATTVGSTALTDTGVIAYLPTSLALQADTLAFGGHQVHQVVLGGRREDATWQANLAAKELNGYIEYRQGVERAGTVTPGRLYARLAKLTLGSGGAPKVEALLDAQPRSIPAVDVIVDEFETHGKSFGRLEVEAINRMATGSPEGVPEWRLNKFNLSVPEATLTSSGNWTRLNAQGEPPPKERAKALEARRTVLNFKLDVVNAGALLTRLGMKDVVRQGKGRLEGQVSWLGSPLQIHYPTLSGAFTVNVTEGQFLKSDPGIAKLFGVLSLQALPRRLTLDFRDVFDDGFAFDFFRGDVKVDHGLAHTNNLQMKGVNAAVLMEGQADIARETQDLKVLVVPEINAGTASLIATVINPAVGLGSFLAQMLLRRPLIASNTKELHVTGGWSDPQVEEIARTAESIKEKKP